MILGITGGTGCGKTTLLDLIRDRGGLVLDCDAIYHELLKTDMDMLHAIADRFPGCVEEGVLDRKKLGAIVFNDEQALQDCIRTIQDEYQSTKVTTDEDLRLRQERMKQRKGIKA